MMNLLRSSMIARATVLLALGVAFSSEYASAQSINQRKTNANATIGGSTLRNGAFTSNAVSSVCGEIPKESSLTGTAVFSIEFPYDPTNDNLQSISFGSKQLVNGVTSSTKFVLNVHVRTSDGGTPPAYVLDTEQGNPKHTGTATLTKTKGMVTLHVVGKEDMGETIDLTVTCM